MHCLITGAGRGIGLELARLLAERGDRVTATVRRPADGAALERFGATVELLDVADPASVAALSERLGEAAVDLLVNNAGIYDEREPLGSVSDAVLAKCFDVNAAGPLRVTQALLPHLHRGTGRKVMQITSRMGSIADNSSGGSYAYRASKAALNALNKSLAVDLAPEGFTCCVLHPGWVATDMGGSTAPVSPAASAVGLLERIDELGPEKSGGFFTFSGEELPW